MFWSRILVGNKITNIVLSKTSVLHISTGVLVRSSKSDRILLQISDGKMRIIIASFLVNRLEFANVDLDILLKKGKEYRLNLIGGDDSEVHLSGYFKSKQTGLKSKNSSLGKKIINKTKEFMVKDENKQNKDIICEEIDEGVNNEEIKKFLNRKTFKELDPPIKLRKLHVKSFKQKNIEGKDC